jgi:hypothetical protein
MSLSASMAKSQSKHRPQHLNTERYFSVGTLDSIKEVPPMSQRTQKVKALDFKTSHKTISSQSTKFETKKTTARTPREI